MVLGLFEMGAQLLLLYGILYIIRRIFEPRILGGANHNVTFFNAVA